MDKELLTLAAALYSRDALEAVITELSPFHFSERSRYMFELFSKMYTDGKIINPSSISLELYHQKAPESERLLFAEISCGYSMAIEIVSDLIQDLKTKKLTFDIKKAAEFIGRSQSEGDQLLNEANEVLSNCANVREKSSSTIKDKLTNWKNSGRNYIEHIEEKRWKHSQGIDTFEGLRTFFPLLDQAIGGLLPGSLTIVGARTSHGKTSWTIALLLNILKNKPNTKIAFYSLEMTSQQLITKFLSEMTGIYTDRIMNGRLSHEELYQVKVAIEKLESYDIIIIEDFSSTIAQVRARLKGTIRKYGVELIVLDYLTKIKSGGTYGTNHLDVSAVSKGLQSFSLETGVPLIVLAQLSRAIATRSGQDKRPQLTDLRESGSIEEDADCVLLLNRPDLTNAQQNGITDLYVAKNRLWDGRLDTIQFTKEKGSFEELPRIQKHIQNINKEDPNDPFSTSALFNEHR